MPHIDVKYFPREVSSEEKEAIAAELCAVIQKHFQSKEGALSVTMGTVAPDNWKADVYDRIIHSPDLVKKPGYQM
ncbi:tautomerase PptA [Shimwellia blattae]|uniref:Tautomerase enzyme family protein n=1 Tax=Shimwellia blattae (strain ATCC 29907 / DSM 4481 / JCM 1650 / NBRC 105725 / CDC 9005-74) TaxID=630626 RepID=I2B946_SHIBC|nr:tautomerase PptA [Shimwellia blattae]AFJ47050.1 tautomerase enzyme family protein [Shimwellia blattae DSM 4481 = NBRC 105725]GAB80828.1 tautomerase PptA [Shimwellia blattae DSM 4481 = NBRC 105725]VDY64543.1 Tautomerase pptA [Shimwellia blattae]VEC22651.1 Tautomerase pptA [Shimwellia blattae]